MTASDTLLVRLPNWLGDVVMTLPVIRALTPKFDVTLRGLPAFAPILAQCFPEIPYDPLPPRQSGYYRSFWRYRGQFKHALLFTNSERGDWESVFSGAKERYGLTWEGRKRRLINHRYHIDDPTDHATIHQTQQWADMVREFQLNGEPIHFAPFTFQGTNKKIPPQNNIVLVCGSANSPEKRWSVSHYRELMMKLLLHYPHSTIILTGSKADMNIATAIARGMPISQVSNLAGKTTLIEFLALSHHSRCVIGNDTGGLHLANAFGVPTIALFGPTNPKRTAPIFDGIKAIIQPPECPKTGGGDINTIEPNAVFQLVRKLIRP